MTRESVKKSLEDHTRKEVDLSDFPGFRRAGVLIILFPSRDGLSVLLTVRTEEVESHRGQVSLPGGMMDIGDKDIVQTALRESAEEIGLEAGRVEVLGLLDDTVVPSQFIITPVVGYVTSKPIVKPSVVEVAEIFDVPLNLFTDEKCVRREDRIIKGKKFPLWFYDYDGKVIWGATAAILRNLATVHSVNK